MDKIEVTQADIDEATSALSNIRGYKVRIYPEHSLVQAFARHRLSHTPQSVEPVATDAPLSFQLVALARIWWDRKMKSQCRSVTLKGDGRVDVHWCDADECGHYTLPVDFVSEVLHPRPPATDVAALVEAAKAILHAVCHETGFAAAVRADSGLAYPWEPLDIAEAQLRQALAPFTKGQDDEA